jgi:RNA polymerase sigma factor (sigma-70 family)
VSPPPDSGSPRFPPTRLSLVEALGATDPVLRTPAYDALVAAYWKPVCRYLEVARRFAREDAEDLTQDFFARAFDRGTLDSYDPARARFRTFLRVCLDRFAANAIERDGRLKRGGGMVSSPLDLAETGPAVDPEQVFRREWIRSLFDAALAAVSEECRRRGKETQFAVFLAYDIEPAADDERPAYRDLAARFDIPVTQVTNYLALVRRAFRKEALERLRAITASPEDFAAEARDLFGTEAG